MKTKYHEPVLKNQVIEAFKDLKNKKIIDCVSFTFY